MLNHLKCGPFHNKKQLIFVNQDKKANLDSVSGGFNYEQSVARRASNTKKKTIKINVRKKVATT